VFPVYDGAQPNSDDRGGGEALAFHLPFSLPSLLKCLSARAGPLGEEPFGWKGLLSSKNVFKGRCRSWPCFARPVQWRVRGKRRTAAFSGENENGTGIKDL